MILKKGGGNMAMILAVDDELPILELIRNGLQKDEIGRASCRERV